MKDNFCAYIDKGMRLHFEEKDGQLYFLRKPCCHLQNDLVPVDFKGYYPINSAKDIFEHPSMYLYKDWFENNKGLPAECWKCAKDEENNNESPRERVNQEHTQFAEYDIGRLDIVLSNKCNLACPFCSSYSSSLIQTISSKMEERPFNWNPNAKYEPSAEKLSNIIADILDTYKVHTFKVIGGEPFLAENWNRIGDTLDSGAGRECHFEVTTNGTVMNHKIINNLKNLKSVKMLISVDSIGKNYDFIRWPHTWDRMKEKLLFIKDNKPDNTIVKISCLINAFNLEFVPDIEKFYEPFGVHINWSLHIKPFNHPLSYENCPQAIVDYVKNNVKSSTLKRGLRSKPIIDDNEVRKQAEIFLKQRNMKAEDVLGPMTREWLGL